MAKRKNPKKNPSSVSTKTKSESPSARWKTSPEVEETFADGESSQSEREEPETGYPPAAVQWLVSLLVVAHLAALFVSYTAIIEAGSTHGDVLAAVSPYLRSTHFAADGRSFYLAHGNSDEQPHRLQVTTLRKDDSLTGPGIEWKTIDPKGIPGLAESDRYARWMALSASLAQSDQSSLAAALVGPMIEQDSSIDAVRIIRLPTMLTTVEDDANAVAYLARVVRDGEAWRLVAVQPKRLTTSIRGEDTP